MSAVLLAGMVEQTPPIIQLWLLTIKQGLLEEDWFATLDEPPWCSMKMSQDKRLLPCASSPPLHVSITLRLESWGIDLGVVHFLPYMINLSAFDWSAPQMPGVHLQGHLVPLAFQSCSHFTLSNEPAPGSWWLVLSSGSLSIPPTLVIAQSLLGCSPQPKCSLDSDVWEPCFFAACPWWPIVSNFLLSCPLDFMHFLGSVFGGQYKAKALGSY